MNYRKHWENVRELGCVISHTTYGVTIHHCHGGSVIDWFGKENSPGMSQRQNHWLVIPLAAKFHTGDEGIDAGFGVRRWEEVYGDQVKHLMAVAERLPYSIWEMAKLPDPTVLGGGYTRGMADWYRERVLRAGRA